MRKRGVIYLTLLLTLLLFSTLFVIGLTVTGAVNDETPPEAVITFDPLTLSIVVVGVDDFDPDVEVTSVILGQKEDKTTMKYILTDDAGNYMTITLELKEKKEHAEVKVLELSYNGGEAIVLGENHYRVHWNPKCPLKHLHQKIDVHHQFKVKTHYKAKRNETKIDIKVEGQPKEKMILPGLVIVSFVTDKGSLNYKIEFTDSVPPEIVGVWRFPETPNYDESVAVVAHVTDIDDFDDDLDDLDDDFDDLNDDFDDDFDDLNDDLNDDNDKQNGVKSVILSYSADSISWVNVTMNLVDGLYVAEIPPLPYDTTVSYKIYAYDWAGNLAISKTYSYVVTDSYPPVISYVDRTPASPDYSETVSVFANVTEPQNASGVKVVILSYWNGYAWTYVDMTLQDMLYAAIIPALPYETTVRYWVRASDWAGNWAASGIYPYTVGAPLNLPPVAKFTESAETVYTGETISFNASESYDPDGDIVSYFWDFGDSTNATDVLAEHAYADDGAYTVTLTVTDDDGAIATATSTKIVLNKPPFASFTENVTTVLTGEVIYFDASDSYDPDGSLIIYVWDFGDGTEATGVTVNHAYDDNDIYTVTLIVIDDDGATASTSAGKTVSNRPPVPSFTEDMTTVETGEAIHFDASGSYDPDGIVVGYFWDFGDGTNATGVTVNHAYADDGNYTVTLTVTDDDGASSSVSATKTVEAPPGWPLALLAAIGLGVAALTATLLYGLYRRRKKGTASNPKNPKNKPIVTLYVPAKILNLLEMKPLKRRRS